MNRDSETQPTADPASWVGEHGDYLFRYALSRLRDREAAEEVVQETFVAGLRAVEQYAGRGSERSWLVGILKRKVIDYVRRRNRELSGVATEENDDIFEILFDQRGRWRDDPRVFGPRPDAALERREFWTALRKCLDDLPEKQRHAFALREIEGLESDKIRKELDISPSNLWVLLHRARLRLGHCLRNRLQLQATS